MQELIQRLAKLIIQDNAILFVGNQLRRSSVDASLEEVSLVEEIAETLAQRIDYRRSDRSLPAVAQDFETLKGRQELVSAILETLETHSSQIEPVEQLLADAVLPHTKIITTRFDQVLENALRDFKKQYVQIVRDTDVPSFDESRVTLIKIYGDATRPDSLVLTEDDIEDFITRLPTVGDVIRAFFATKTLIFLGYDLKGELFKRAYRQVTRNLSAFYRPSYAITSDPLDEVQIQYWKKQNIQIFVQDPLEFMEVLSQEVKRLEKAPVEQTTNPILSLAKPPLPERPYKSLVNFSAQDATIFAGRAEESQRLTNRILANRVTVLYGESGSGKTSLLLAGAGPRLAAWRSLLAVCEPGAGTPLSSQLFSSLLNAGVQAGMEAHPDADLPGLVRQWAEDLDGPLTLAIDQFEQFFLVYTPEARREAAAFLNQLANDRRLDLRLVIILREDYLGHMEELETAFPGLLEVRFRLERLGREAARAAIEEPARLFGVRWEPLLVQALLDELYDNAAGGVAPPQLQIICDRLYQVTTGDGKPSTPGGEAVITLDQFKSLGGANAMLGDFLEHALSELNPEQQPLARSLLGALVSSSGIKQRLELEDLARSANIDETQAAVILDQLTRQRILQRFRNQASDESSAEKPRERLEYQLTHDYLAARIALWLGDEFWAAQKVREILRAALPEWKGRNRLLPPEDLRLAHAQSGRVSFSPAENELLYATAVAYEADPSIWRLELTDETRLQVLLRLTSHPEASPRRQAARKLGAFPVELAAQMLARLALDDPDPAVRTTAAEIIALPMPSSGPLLPALDALIQAATADGKASQALQALVVARDLQPNVEFRMPPRLQQTTRRIVRRQRWQRKREVILRTTLRGVQGGFFSLGLGFGAFVGLNAVMRAAQGFSVSSLPWQVILSVMTGGIPLAGVVGAFSGGSSAFFGAWLESVQDQPRPALAWLVRTVAGALAMGMGFVFLAYIFSAAGQARPLRSLAAGILIGLGLAGSAALPLKLKPLARLLLCVLGGSAAFVLAWVLGWIFSHIFWWLLMMGAIGGVGYFWGIYQPERGKNETIA
jgi:hypothetical protein